MTPLTRRNFCKHTIGIALGTLASLTGAPTEAGISLPSSRRWIAARSSYDAFRRWWYDLWHPVSLYQPAAPGITMDTIAPIAQLTSTIMQETVSASPMSLFTFKPIIHPDAYLDLERKLNTVTEEYIPISSEGRDDGWETGDGLYNRAAPQNDSTVKEGMTAMLACEDSTDREIKAANWREF